MLHIYIYHKVATFGPPTVVLMFYCNSLIIICYVHSKKRLEKLSQTYIHQYFVALRTKLRVEVGRRVVLSQYSDFMLDVQYEDQEKL